MYRKFPKVTWINIEVFEKSNKSLCIFTDIFEKSGKNVYCLFQKTNKVVIGNRIFLKNSYKAMFFPNVLKFL